MEKFPITVGGLLDLKDELKKLKTIERPSIIQDIADARALGDLSENAEYHAAREKQSFTEGKILDIEDKIARSEVIDVTKMNGTKIKFGASITLVDDNTDEEIFYQIVGESEADLSKHKISYTSPIARAMISKEEGDTVAANTPSGKKIYEIIKVEYK